MEPGSTSNPRSQRKRHGNYANTKPLASMLPKIDAFTPRPDHDPKELKSWAKRTGFVSTFSTETNTTNTNSDRFGTTTGFDVEKGAAGGSADSNHHRNGGSSPKIEIDPFLGRARVGRGGDIEPENGLGSVLRGREDNNKKKRVGDEFGLECKDERNKKDNANVNGSLNGNGNGVPGSEMRKEEGSDGRELGIDVFPGGEEAPDGGWYRQSGMRFGLRDNPGIG